MAKLRRFSGTPVAEGVRLEVGRYTVFAVRDEKKDISVRVRREPRRFLRACMDVPLLRGAARLIHGVARFFDGIGESAELRPQRPVRGTAVEQAIARFLRIRPQTLATLLSAILIVLLAALCLYAAPAGAQLLLERHAALSRVWIDYLSALVRIVGLLIAVGLLCRLRVFKRLAMYKGAINKVVNCYECRDEVNAANAARHSICARRSDPAFLLCALIAALLLFPLLPRRGPAVTAILRVLVLLAAAGVLNEPFSALEEARKVTPLVRALRTPMDLLQHMTTLEPHPQMLEVAVCAFDAAMAGSRDETKTEVNSDDHIGMDDEGD